MGEIYNESSKLYKELEKDFAGKLKIDCKGYK